MEESKFASRGGLKLQAALENFSIAVNGKTILDVGSSTGGFVDCLLKNGAIKVYALDTAYGILDWNLRNDKRVVVMERTNILYLKDFPEQVDLVTIDASWTKLEIILPIVKNFLQPEGRIIALLKPHYEAPALTRRNGIVPLEMVEKVKESVINNIAKLGLKVEKIIDSPILGGAGNKEFLLLISVVKNGQRT